MYEGYIADSICHDAWTHYSYEDDQFCLDKTTCKLYRPEVVLNTNSDSNYMWIEVDSSPTFEFIDMSNNNRFQIDVVKKSITLLDGSNVTKSSSKKTGASILTKCVSKCALMLGTSIMVGVGLHYCLKNNKFCKSLESPSYDSRFDSSYSL